MLVSKEAYTSVYMHSVLVNMHVLASMRQHALFLCVPNHAMTPHNQGLYLDALVLTKRCVRMPVELR